MLAFPHFFSFILLFLCVQACAPSCELMKTEDKTTSLFLEAMMIDNAMPSGDLPMVTRKPYLILKICPGNAVFDEDVKVTFVRLEGTKGVWESSTFDRNVMEGKGFSELNATTRNVDEFIGPIQSVKAGIEYACGKIDTLVASQCKTQVVY